jgi:hypothetical protein
MKNRVEIRQLLLILPKKSKIACDNGLINCCIDLPWLVVWRKSAGLFYRNFLADAAFGVKRCIAAHSFRLRHRDIDNANWCSSFKGSDIFRSLKKDSLSRLTAGPSDMWREKEIRQLGIKERVA